MALIEKLSAIGDAIREKNGTSDLIPLADMPQAIRDISSPSVAKMVEYTTSATMVSPTISGSTSILVKESE